MSPNKISIILVLFISLTLNLQSQDYTQIQESLESRKEHFQLVVSSVDQAKRLKVADLFVFNDEVLLELEFVADSDSILGIWNNFTESFKKTNPISFEQWLLIKMSSSFDLPLEAISIRIFSSFEEDEIPQLDGSISVNRETNEIEVRFDFRSVVKGYIQLDQVLIDEKFKNVFDEVLHDESEDVIYERIFLKIKGKAKEYFEKSDSVYVTNNNYKNIIIIDVENIQGEVVDSQKGFLAKFKNPVEKLKITLVFTFDTFKNSITCAVDIDGKYGSGIGFFKPTNNANYIEMFPKYESELNDYMDKKFIPLLKRWLR